MRVHPGRLSLASTASKLGAVFGICLAIAALGFARELPINITIKQKGVVSELKSNNTIEVLVARSVIEPGAYLDDSNLGFESRNPEHLPDDAVTQWPAIKGKVAIAQISKNTVISRASLGMPVALIPAMIEPADVPPEVAVQGIRNSNQKLLEKTTP